MPTTPNPTPPTSDPGTGAPDAPVYNTTKPDMLGMSVNLARSQIGYTDHDYDTYRYRSPYYDVPAEPFPGTLFLDGVCPGRWSRRYFSASDAESLPGGSGYFGYDTNDLNWWWSTNFIDDGDAACSMVASQGQYFSKNTTIDSTHILMGAVTVDATDVKLKWGSTWGLVTRNAVFDYLDSTTTYVSRSTTIPRNADGTVDVTALNLSVMKYAPVRGCFVMFDMASNVVLYTMMDGEQKQFAGSKLGSVAPALALRTATDPNSLPLTSKLISLPVFTSGYVSVGTVNTTYTVNNSSTPDKSKVWRSILTGHWTEEGLGGVMNGTQYGTYTSLAAAQAVTNPVSGVVGQSGTTFFTGAAPFRVIPYTSGPVSIYSGWAGTGTPYQVVGWISRVSGGTPYLVSTAYGITSTAPSASVQGASSFMPASADVQAEILGKCPDTSKFSLGFVYDASVGAYGQVTWISQL